MVPVIHRLRAEPGAVGAVTTVSGLLTKPGLGMWTTRPDGQPPLVGDLGPEAEATTGVVEVVGELDGYDGGATVATYTVTYEGLDPVRTVAVCDTDDGRRCVAISDDADTAAWAVSHEPIGTRVDVHGGSFEPI
jgi:acetyl-CoA C-acetyltransferase